MSISNFKAVCPPIPEKKSFKGFFTINRRGGHVSHVTWTVGSFIGNFVTIGPVGFEGIFEIVTV